MNLRSLPLALLVVGLSVGSAPHVRSQPVLQVQQLDRQVEQGQLAEANFSLHRVASLTPTLVQWLEEKAVAGLPPFQYEHSRRLLATDPQAAVRWYARGYVARSLDFAECTEKGRNPIQMVIGTVYGPILNEALKDRPAYARELEAAIQWEAERAVQPDSNWICQGFQLPLEKRSAARAAQLGEIRAGIDRLKAAPSLQR